MWILFEREERERERKTIRLMILFVLLLHLIFDPFVYNQYLQIIVIPWKYRTKRARRRNDQIDLPDDNVVSLFEPAVAVEVLADEEDDDVDDVVSACVHGGPCIIEPSGGWSHWSKARASFACCCCCEGCITGFFIGVFDGDTICCCWSSLPFGIALDDNNSLWLPVIFSVFNFDKPLLRWCRGDNVATVFGGGWLK